MVAVLSEYSQDIGDDADGPHVGGVADGVKVDHLGRHELGRAEQHLQLLGRVVSARQAEVNDLDPVPRLGETENVLRLPGNKGDVMSDLGGM